MVDRARRAARPPGSGADRRSQRRPRNGPARSGSRAVGLHALRCRARGELGHRTARARRSTHCPRGARQGLPCPARADGQHPPLAPRRPHLRGVLGRPFAQRPVGSRVHPRCAGERRCCHGQASRRQRERARAHDRRFGHRRAHVARDLPVAVRDGGTRRRRARGHDRLQPAERGLVRRERTAARDPAAGVGLRRRGDDRLVRRHSHGHRHAGGPHAGDARSGPRVRTGGRGGGREGRPRRAHAHGCDPAAAGNLRVCRRFRADARAGGRPAGRSAAAAPGGRGELRAPDERRCAAARTACPALARHHRAECCAYPDRRRRIGTGASVSARIHPGCDTRAAR